MSAKFRVVTVGCLKVVIVYIAFRFRFDGQELSGKRRRDLSFVGEIFK